MKESHSRMKTMRPLKADLHIHTAEDPLDRVKYTAQDLIIKAADEKFDVLAITNHHSMTFNQELFSFARERGVFLIPGIEITVKKRHVVILNPPRGKTFSDFTSLLKWRRPETLIIAPHPYFPSTYSLNGYLLKHLNLFDALEYCHFYSPLINFNLKAIEVSQSYGFPLLGNSDAHFISQLGTTYSLIYAEKTLESIFSAIRNHRVKIVSRPLSSLEMGSIANRFLRMKLRTKIVRPRHRPKPPSIEPSEGHHTLRAV